MCASAHTQRVQLGTLMRLRPASTLDMMDKPVIGLAVGVPEKMSKVEHMLRKLWFQQVVTAPEYLKHNQYTKLDLWEIFDSIDSSNTPLLIAWRCDTITDGIPMATTAPSYRVH